MAEGSSDVSLSEGGAAAPSTKGEETSTENDSFNSETIVVPQNNESVLEDDFADFQEAIVEQENDEETCGVLEQTIATMEESQLCFHPVHHHSFSPVSILLSGSMRKCVGCEQRLKAVLGVSSVVHDQIVRCVSCGAYAHRSCAMDTPSRPKDFSLMWNTKCPVNTVIIEGNNRMESDGLQGSPTVGVEEGDDDEKDDNSGILIPSLDENTENENDEGGSQSSFFQFLSPSNLLFTKSQQHAEETSEEAPKEQSVSSDEDEEFLLWTSDGPPRHWASEQALSGIHRLNTSTEAAENDATEEENANTPLHVANNTFATVSKAIQENIVAHFIRRPFIEKVISLDLQDNGQTDDPPSTPESPAHKTAACSTETLHTADSPVSRVQVEALLAEVEPSSPKRGSIARMASGTMEVAKTSANMRKKMGIVSVAGGIAGGVAGLVMAGPAGAVIGAKCGQTAGLLGVLIEGSMTVGVFVAGIAAGSLTAQHIQQQQEKRVLTIGEDGVKQKLLLVRPNIAIDPVWSDICDEARRSHLSSSKVFGILPSSKGSLSKKERYKRDSDIVETDESEIPTADKVLLLVSRSLNDKEGLPGHVYRCLIQDYRDRSKERDGMTIEDAIEEEIQTPDVDGVVVEDVDHDDTELLVDDANSDNNDTRQKSDLCTNIMRARRQDTHAVIKHVTATLLEVRPGFASSPAITEMSATAVESLVFGELYDDVFEEIVEETRECDTALMNKIRAFDKSHEALSVNENGETATDYPSDLVSQPAIDSLLLLPEAHSTADKLRYCVEFLELISVHFTQTTTKSSEEHSCLSADSLLKMVCQHIIAAKVPNMNAEILFLEEFARDEQLLRGKEGYALVTLQASLHFLNTSTDFDQNIFGQDEE